ncbi:MAG: GNAT family N-acetyltransferase [Candidatus Sericytochromatia bacterium]
MNELTFRVPTTDDLEAILALMNDPGSVHRRTTCRHAAVVESASQLYDRLYEDENLVAESGGRVLGFASWQTYGRHVHLNAISVAGATQRQGVGHALFTAFQEAAREQGAVSFSLRAYRDSDWALRFYARHGLRPVQDVVALVRRDDGFRHYVSASMENGQWPAEEKVVFFGDLA